MPVITYLAVDRGELQGAHVEGVEYQIEVLFEAYPRKLTFKGMREETLDGTPEGYLHAVQRAYAIQTSFILLADRPKWREFFGSVMNAETFQVDFTGTIAVPGTDVNVWMEDAEVGEQQVGGVGVQYAFRVKALP